MHLLFLQVPGISLETRKDCLWSIIAQLLYHHEIMDLEKGHHFRMYANIPKIDNITGLPFHEREEHNKLLLHNYLEVSFM